MPVMLVLSSAETPIEVGILHLGVAAQLVASGRSVLVVEADPARSWLPSRAGASPAGGFAALLRTPSRSPPTLDLGGLLAPLLWLAPGAGLHVLGGGPGEGPLPSLPDPEEPAPWRRLAQTLSSLPLAGRPPEVILVRLPPAEHPITLGWLCWCADVVAWLSTAQPVPLGRSQRLEALVAQRRHRPLPSVSVAQCAGATLSQAEGLTWIAACGRLPDLGLPGGVEPTQPWAALAQPEQVRAHHALGVLLMRAALAS